MPTAVKQNTYEAVKIRTLGTDGMDDFNFDSAAELPILRDFIDFVNKQSSVYVDCLNGFDGNTVRIERQVARITFPAGKGLCDGQDLTVYDCMEDPRQPDSIHNIIRKGSSYLNDNREGGFNEQQIFWSIKPNDIKIDALGDLRILRKAVVHAKGIVTDAEHAKLKKMSELVEPGAKLALGAPSPEDIVDVAIQNAGPRKGRGF